MQKITHSLLIAAAAILVGCAHNSNVRTTGSIEPAQLQGRTFTVQGQSAVAGRVSEGLKAAGMKQGAAGNADYIVTVSQEDRTATRRLHTGGKTGLAYDKEVRESVLVLTVSKSTEPGKPVFTATAEGGDAESLTAAALASIRN